MAETKFHTQSFAIYLQKNNPINGDINKQYKNILFCGKQELIDKYCRIMRLHESGLIIEAERRFRSSHNPCSAKEKVRPKIRRLTLKDFSGLFYFFAVGVFFSLAVFLCELLNGRKMHRQPLTTKYESHIHFRSCTHKCLD